MNPWDQFSGPNSGYVLELYERFLRDPASVDADTRAFFSANPPPPGWDGRATPAPAPTAAAGADAQKITAAFNLAQSIRTYGYFAAELDPLGSPPPGDNSLLPETHGLSEADLRAIPAGVVGGYAAEHSRTAWEAIQYLRETYCGPVGHDYLQVRNAEQRAWLRDAAESGRFSLAQDPVDPVDLLRRLTQVEVFEHFLQRSFVGKTRFSIEGLDTMVPLLDVLIGAAGEAGIFHILLGMAHRGRLNILAHLLNKPTEQILAEFKDPLVRGTLQNEPDGWTGDVKYHAGARRDIDMDNDPDTIELSVQMAPNPSHLEAVNPVIEGMARAAGTRVGQAGA
ncbi:MAG TPA: hypothetical protein PJ988_21270, partial [Anaerolinea sp.]|nr:hypothetical protein [Anaerolinea sp.]